MKIYTAEKIFSDPEFPLVCTLASQRESMFPHCHDFVEIVLVTRGCTLQTISGGGSGQTDVRLIRGHLFSIRPGEVHSYRSSSNFEIYNMALNPSLLGRDLEPLLEIEGVRSLVAPSPSDGERKFLYLLPRQRREVLNLFQRISLNGQPHDELRRLEQRILLIRFFMALRRTPFRESGEMESSDGVHFLSALDYIEEHPKGKDSLADLARIASMSVSGFTAAFRREFGMSVGEYRQMLRLDHAHTLLLKTSLGLDAIAQEAGFCDGNYFIKLYRRHYGVSPGKYRRESGSAS